MKFLSDVVADHSYPVGLSAPTPIAWAFVAVFYTEEQDQ